MVALSFVSVKDVKLFRNFVFFCFISIIQENVNKVLVLKIYIFLIYLIMHISIV